MATVELQVRQWQERGIQVMVLLSFTMQLMLLVLAEFRQRIDSSMLRGMIWSAYMLADSTAIYTLAHLSVTSRSDDHELKAFWAPFLLLHLGGQDNITAYAIEDNRLWLRHLQALIVQVAATAYVLYESTVVSTQALLQNASILMFVLGILKYGERVWALKCADTSASGNKYRYFEGTIPPLINPSMDWQGDTECLLRIAHLLLDVPKNLLRGPLPKVVVHMNGENEVVPANELYKVVEMQLSLMHDVVYTKAEVIHTWYGLCIRVISPVFTAIAFGLFHGSGLSVGDHHYSKADVVITYVLLGGAVTLEIVSVLRAMFSRWPSVILGNLAFVVEKRCMWSLLARAIAYVRRFVLPKRDGSKWWWSNSMGQHNLFDLCVRSRANRGSRIAGWMGVEVWWNTMVYSNSIPVSTAIKKLLVDQMLKTSESPDNDVPRYQYKSTEEGADHIINSRGRTILMDCWIGSETRERYLSMEFDESILVWHIATNIYLLHPRGRQAAADDAGHLAKAIEAISNYMLFLLAARPYMLPGSVSRTRYIEMCYCLTDMGNNTTQDLADNLITLHSGPKNTTLLASCELARELVGLASDQSMQLKRLAQVWTEMLCYAGYRCSGYSHVKQLSNGGELLTVAALVVDYGRRNILLRACETQWESTPLTSAA